MDWKIFVTIFATVFLAELGDKTQIATLLYAADREVSKTMVFIAASLALVFASGLAVAAGALIAERVSPRHLSIAAGLGFIAVGAWTLMRA